MVKSLVDIDILIHMIATSKKTFMHDDMFSYWHVGLAVEAPGDDFLVAGLARRLVEGDFS